MTELRPIADPRQWQRLSFVARQRRAAQVRRAVEVAARTHRRNYPDAEDRIAVIAPPRRRRYSELDLIARRLYNRDKSRKRRAAETPEQRRARLDREIERRRNRTPEQRAREKWVLERLRAAETPEQRARRLEVKRVKERARRAAMTPEQREAVNARRRVVPAQPRAVA